MIKYSFFCHIVHEWEHKKYGDFIIMTQLAIISTIIGIIAGAIAILEKAFGIFGGKKRRHRKIFKDEFGRCVVSLSKETKTIKMARGRQCR